LADRVAVAIYAIELVLSLVIGALTFYLTLSLSASLLITVASFFGSIGLERILKKRLRPRLYRNPVISKKTFAQAKVPTGYETWNHFTVSLLKSNGMKPLSYPLDAPQLEIPAYEVFGISEGSTLALPVFKQISDPWVEDPGRPFRSRVDRSVSPESRNHFTANEIMRHRESRDKEITDDPAVAVEDIVLDPFPVISYTITRYWDLYILVNQIGYMTGKFPREPDYPIKQILKELPMMKNHDYRILRQIPSILGAEIIVITKDGKFVFQERSHKEAVYSGLLTSGVSFGYEPNKEAERFEGWENGAVQEMKNELGVVKDRILEIELLSLIHIIPSNELNFIILAKVDYDFETLDKMAKEARKKKESVQIKEAWEHVRLVPFPANEIAQFEGSWKRFFETALSGDPSRMERIVQATHYYSKKYP